MTGRLQRKRRDSGSALIEFALSAVVLLVVLLGIIDVGRALYAYDWLSHSARAATRWAMVRGLTCTKLPVGCPAHLSDVTSYVENTNGNGLDTTGIDISQLTVNMVCYVGPNISSPPPCTQRTWVNVSLKYEFHFLSPFASFIPAWQMSSSSQRFVQE